MTPTEPQGAGRPDSDAALSPRSAPLAGGARAALALALTALLLALLSHRSGSPAVLGRYSWGHAVLIAGFSLAALAALRALSSRSGLGPQLVAALQARPAAVALVCSTLCSVVSVAGLAGLLHASLGISILAGAWTATVVVVAAAARSKTPAALAGRIGPLAGPALLLAALLVSALSAELLLRAFWPVPHYLDRMAFPAKYQVTAEGFRERPLGPKRSGTFRVVFLGDSNTFGWGVDPDEPFPRLLEASLQRSGSDIEVLNLAKPGLNTVEELEILERHGAGLAPDLVVLGYTTNDAQPPSATVVAPVGGSAAAGSNRFRNYVGQMRLLLLLDAVNIQNRIRTTSLGKVDPQAEQAGLRESVRALVAIRDRAAAFGARFAMVLIPALADFEHYPRAELHQALAAATTEHGIAYLDLLPTFRASGLTAEQLDFGDGHPKTCGHVLITTALGSFLRERGLLPGPRAGAQAGPEVPASAAK